MKKIEILMVVLGVVFSGLIYSHFILADRPALDNAGFNPNIPVDNPAANSNIGAWSDEEWTARAYFVTKIGTCSSAFCTEGVYYEFQNALDSSSGNTIAPQAEYAIGNLEVTGGGVTKDYRITTKRDAVVTRWSASGHVHYPTNI